MKLKPLEFITFRNMHSESLIAEITNLNGYYCIWFEKSVGKFKVSDPKCNHYYFESLQKAKWFCQKDYKEKILNLFT